MPSKSTKQKKFMAADAHNPQSAKKAGIATKVAKEFNRSLLQTRRVGMKKK